jgi:hypothetical protein
MSTIDDMKARLERLKTTKYSLPADVEEEAAVAKAIVEHERRIDEEGAEALRKLATMHEARVIASLPESTRGSATVRCVYDWPTHKRTMTGNDITTGRGILVVVAPDSDVAAKAFRKRNRVGSGSADFVDMSQETVNSVLMKVAKFPAPDVVQVMLVESEPLCQTAYQTAMALSGTLARELSGKSES